MHSSAKEQIVYLQNLLTIRPASALIKDGKDQWSPTNGYAAVIANSGPAVFRVEAPRSVGEERLLTGWLHHWREFHPHFFPIGISTPVEYLFDSYSLCRSLHLHQKYLGIAMLLPWDDPSIRYKQNPPLDPIRQRKLLARFNFPALLSVIQYFSGLAKKAVQEADLGAEGYHLTAVVDSFYREAHSVLAEEACRSLDDLWAKYSEATQSRELGLTLMEASSWEDLRTALVYQYAALGSLIQAIWRVGEETKGLEFIVEAGLLLATVLGEELASSVSFPKGRLPMQWDAKALTWHAMCASLKTTSLVMGGSEPGVADDLFALFAASAVVRRSYGAAHHLSCLLRWSPLLSISDKLLERQGVEKYAEWYGKIRKNQKGRLAQDFVILYKIQHLFKFTLEELAYQDYRYVKFIQSVPDEMKRLFPPF